MPWSRRTLFVTAGVVVAALVVGGLVWHAKATTTVPVTIVASTGTGWCPHFPATGSRIKDQALLDRALEEWQSDIKERQDDAEHDGTTPPDSLKGTICAIEAEAVGDTTYVTMAGARSRATFHERGEHEDPLGAIDITEDGIEYATPAVSVGGGRWMLASGASNAVLHLGSAARPEGVVPIKQGSPVVDVGDASGRYASGQSVQTVQGLPVIADPRDNGHRDIAFSGPGDGVPRLVHRGEQHLVGGELARPGAVAMLSAAINEASSDPDHHQAPRVRILQIVGQATAPGVGPVMVVASTPDYADTGDSRVLLEGVSLDQVSSISVGTFPRSDASRGAGWAGGTWVAPPTATAPDPHVFIAAGVGPATDTKPLSLQVRVGAGTVTRTGPFAVLTSADLPGIASGRDRPPSLVIGTRANGSIVSALVPTQ